MKTIDDIDKLRDDYVSQGNYNFLPPDEECSKKQLSDKKKRNKELDFFKQCRLYLEIGSESHLKNELKRLSEMYERIDDRVISKKMSSAEYKQLLNEKKKRLKTISKQVDMIKFLLD